MYNNILLAATLYLETSICEAAVNLPSKEILEPQNAALGRECKDRQ